MKIMWCIRKVVYINKLFHSLYKNEKCSISLSNSSRKIVINVIMMNSFLIMTKGIATTHIDVIVFQMITVLCNPDSSDSWSWFSLRLNF